MNTKERRAYENPLYEMLPHLTAVVVCFLASGVMSWAVMEGWV